MNSARNLAAYLVVQARFSIQVVTMSYIRLLAGRTH